jgi:hypothetical protein
MNMTDILTTQKSTSSDIFPLKLQAMPQANPKYVRRASMACTNQKQNQYISNQRRQSLMAINNNFFSPNRSTFSVPLLIDTMNTFYQSIQIMEEEIMLPSRLKDMPVEGKINLIGRERQ